jgi:uncharacterized membrane protein
MRTPASIARHPIHPMLVPLPIGLWIFSLVCDLFYIGGSTNPAWTTVAFYCMGGGIVGALLAAVPGLIDLLSLPAGPRGTAIKHMAINLTVVVLYLVNFWMRMEPPHTPGKLVWLSLISVGLLAISGWLGGKMVFEHGIAVDTPPDSTRR